jgi:hypothetical protein
MKVRMIERMERVVVAAKRDFRSPTLLPSQLYSMSTPPELRLQDPEEGLPQSTDWYQVDAWGVGTVAYLLLTKDVGLLRANQAAWERREAVSLF